MSQKIEKSVFDAEKRGLTTVRKIALSSRLILLVLQALLNNVIPDHKPDVFNPPSTDLACPADQIVTWLLEGFRRWDAIYFLFIAEHGYIYQNCLAFFPLYPLIVGSCARFLNLIPKFMSLSSWLLIVGSSLNIYFFVKAAESLYLWSKTLVERRFEKYALAAAIAFCFNPASVFFSACYSESLFAFLTFSGLKYLERERASSIGMQSAFSLVLSGAARANGFVNVGFLVEKLLRRFDLFRDSHSSLLKKKIYLGEFLFTFLKCCLLAFAGFTPFVGFQFFAYQRYCGNRPAAVHTLLHEYGDVRGYRILTSSSPPPWCQAFMPNSYFHVQSSHWNVGFLQYYQLIQIPNFVLAAPIVALSCWTIFRIRAEKAIVTLLPYAAHLLFLICFCAFFVHVQISTRMICSSSPLIFLLVGKQFGEITEVEFFRYSYVSRFKNLTQSQKIIVIYFLSYFVIGTFLHCNFYPWT